MTDHTALEAQAAEIERLTTQTELQYQHDSQEIAALRAQLAAAQGQVEKSEERSADYWASKYPVPLGYKLVKESWESAPPLSQDNPDFIVIPVEYQYAYPDGSWRCSNGDTINGMKPTASRALYATRNSS